MYNCQVTAFAQAAAASSGSSSSSGRYIVSIHKSHDTVLPLRVRRCSPTGWCVCLMSLCVSACQQRPSVQRPASALDHGRGAAAAATAALLRASHVSRFALWHTCKRNILLVADTAGRYHYFCGRVSAARPRPVGFRGAGRTVQNCVLLHDGE